MRKRAFLMVQLNWSVFVNVYGVGEGVDWGCMPCPPVRNDIVTPASLVLSINVKILGVTQSQGKKNGASA